MKRSGRYSFGDRVANTAYTPEQDRILMEMVSEGEYWYTIADRLGRTWRAVEERFHVLRKQMGPQAE